MHELSLCGAIADIVTRTAANRPVEVVHVRVGQLRQVVPQTLDFCWELVVAQTPLEGSVLAIERVPAVVNCRACAAEAPVGDAISLVCPTCGGFQVDVVAGEEFDVTALDLASA